MRLLALQERGTVVSVHEIHDGQVSQRGEVDVPELADPNAFFFDWSDAAGVLTLLLPPGSRMPILRSRDGGRTFRHPPEYPGETLPNEGCYRVQHDGSLTIIDGMRSSWDLDDPSKHGGCIWRLALGEDQWRAHPYHGPVLVRDVSLDAQGRLLVAGAVPSGTSRETRALYARLEDGRTEPLDIELGWWDARRLRNGGGAECFRGIWAETEPVIIQSSCAWFLDDPTDYVLLVAGGRGTVLRLKRQYFRIAWRAPRGAISIHAGDSLYQTWDHGRRWREQTLGGMLAPWWHRPVSSVVDVAVSDAGIAACVSHRHEGTALASAILVSTDGGARFEVAAEIEEPGAAFFRVLFTPD